MNFLGLNGRVSIIFEFKPANRHKAILSRHLAKGNVEKPEPLPLFSISEPIVGMVTILVSPGKRIEHLGIKIESICQIGSYTDQISQFKLHTAVKDLEAPTTLEGNKQYYVEFDPANVPYESYDGYKFYLRYFLSVSINQKFSVTTKEFDYIVQNASPVVGPNPPLKMEVGIEDCLHIEFEYDKSKYHLEDVAIGKIYFLLVRIKIKSMELGIIQREVHGPENALQIHSQTIVKYEVMDGSPINGECIPLRIFLKPYNLTPTYHQVHDKFSVKYFFNLVIVDVENRRYFKQQEIELYRLKIG